MPKKHRITTKTLKFLRFKPNINNYHYPTKAQLDTIYKPTKNNKHPRFYLIAESMVFMTPVKYLITKALAYSMEETANPLEWQKGIKIRIQGYADASGLHHMANVQIVNSNEKTKDTELQHTKPFSNGPSVMMHLSNPEKKQSEAVSQKESKADVQASHMAVISASNSIKRQQLKRNKLMATSASSTSHKPKKRHTSHKKKSILGGGLIHGFIKHFTEPKPSPKTAKKSSVASKPKVFQGFATFQTSNKINKATSSKSSERTSTAFTMNPFKTFTKSKASNTSESKQSATVSSAQSSSVAKSQKAVSKKSSQSSSVNSAEQSSQITSASSKATSSYDKAVKSAKASQAEEHKAKTVADSKKKIKSLNSANAAKKSKASQASKKANQASSASVSDQAKKNKAPVSSAKKTSEQSKNDNTSSKASGVSASSSEKATGSSSAANSVKSSMTSAQSKSASIAAVRANIRKANEEQTQSAKPKSAKNSAKPSSASNSVSSEQSSQSNLSTVASQTGSSEKANTIAFGSEQIPLSPTVNGASDNSNQETSSAKNDNTKASAKESNQVSSSASVKAEKASEDTSKANSAKSSSASVSASLSNSTKSSQKAKAEAHYNHEEAVLNQANGDIDKMVKKSLDKSSKQATVDVPEINNTSEIMQLTPKEKHIQRQYDNMLNISQRLTPQQLNDKLRDIYHLEGWDKFFAKNDTTFLDNLKANLHSTLSNEGIKYLLSYNNIPDMFAIHALAKQSHDKDLKVKKSTK